MDTVITPYFSFILLDILRSASYTVFLRVCGVSASDTCPTSYPTICYNVQSIFKIKKKNSSFGLTFCNHQCAGWICFEKSKPICMHPLCEEIEIMITSEVKMFSQMLLFHSCHKVDHCYPPRFLRSCSAFLIYTNFFIRRIKKYPISAQISNKKK